MLLPGCACQTGAMTSMIWDLGGTLMDTYPDVDRNSFTHDLVGGNWHGLR